MAPIATLCRWQAGPVITVATVGRQRSPVATEVVASDVTHTTVIRLYPLQLILIDLV
jgi:hypothetical protein